MKGIIFTEFLEFVEQRFSLEMADDIIHASELPSGGAYTAVGTYDHHEILELVNTLSILSGTPVADLVRSFGFHLFGRLAAIYSFLLDGIDSAFSCLGSIGDHIHMEVKKLYPDTELPHIECSSQESKRMMLVYRSQRPFGDLAEGLIAGCCAHFGEDIAILRENLPNDDETAIRFLLVHRG